MIPRPLLTTLVFALPVLAITIGAVLGGAELARSLGDSAGAHGLVWVAIAALLLLVIDAVLLLTLLGLRALNDGEEDQS
jgi:hypothetical protein